MHLVLARRCNGGEYDRSWVGGQRRLRRAAALIEARDGATSVSAAPVGEVVGWRRAHCGASIVDAPRTHRCPAPKPKAGPNDITRELKIPGR